MVQRQVSDFAGIARYDERHPEIFAVDFCLFRSLHTCSAVARLTLCSKANPCVVSERAEAG